MAAIWIKRNGHFDRSHGTVAEIHCRHRIFTPAANGVTLVFDEQGCWQALESLDPSISMNDERNPTVRVFFHRILFRIASHLQPFLKRANAPGFTRYRDERVAVTRDLGNRIHRCPGGNRATIGGERAPVPRDDGHATVTVTGSTLDESATAICVKHSSTVGAISSLNADARATRRILNGTNCAATPCSE